MAGGMTMMNLVSFSGSLSGFFVYGAGHWDDAAFGQPARPGDESGKRSVRLKRA